METIHCEPDPETSNAQSPNCSPTKRASSVDQLASSNKHAKAQALKSLLVEKVRGVKVLGHRFNKLGRHLSTSDQSELAVGPRLLSVASIDPDIEVPRLVRTNAIKVSFLLPWILNI